MADSGDAERHGLRRRLRRLCRVGLILDRCAGAGNDAAPEVPVAVHALVVVRPGNLPVRAVNPDTARTDVEILEMNAQRAGVRGSYAQAPEPPGDGRLPSARDGRSGGAASGDQRNRSLRQLAMDADGRQSPLRPQALQLVRSQRRQRRFNGRRKAQPCTGRLRRRRALDRPGLRLIATLEDRRPDRFLPPSRRQRQREGDEKENAGAEQRRPCGRHPQHKPTAAHLHVSCLHDFVLAALLIIWQL